MRSLTSAIPTSLSFDGLISFICSHNWSPSTFKNNYRKKDNFECTQLIVLDVDDGPNIDEAFKLFCDYKNIIAPTKSHQIEKNGIICDRYRVILFLESGIRDNNTFSATWQSLYNNFPFIDKACKDSSRFFYKSQYVYKANIEGKLISVTEAPIKKYDNTVHNFKGYYPPSYLYAKNWGIPQGRRNDTIFRISCELFRCGYSVDEVFDLINTITDLPEQEVNITVRSASRAILK